MTEPRSLTDIQQNGAQVGDIASVEVIGTETAPFIPADSAFIFGVGPITELLFAVNQAGNIRNKMTVIAVDGPKITFSEVKSELDLQVVATGRVRLDGEATLLLANNLINHLKENFPNLAAKLEI